MALHNKSGLANLTIAGLDVGELHRLRAAFDSSEKISFEGLAATNCVTLKNADGRVSSRGKKMAFGYQVVALQKFGPDALASIPASKRADDALLSHLCGTRNCLVAEHIIIEAKRINDERTHCHFCLNNIKEKAGSSAMTHALDSGLCPHNPRCGSLDH